MTILDLTLKSMKGEIQKIQVNSTDVISSRLNQIKTYFEYDANTEIKLIHIGRVLDVDKKFDEFEINSNDCIIIMKVPQKPVKSTSLPPPPVVQSNSSTTHTPHIQHTQNQNPQVNMSTHPPTHPPSYWTQPVQQQDTVPNYSFEQILAIVPLFISTLVQEPSFMMLLLTNPNGAVGTIATTSFDQTMLRQLLIQSTQIINLRRSGIPVVSQLITSTTQNQSPSGMHGILNLTSATGSALAPALASVPTQSQTNVSIDGLQNALRGVISNFQQSQQPQQSHQDQQSQQHVLNHNTESQLISTPANTPVQHTNNYNSNFMDMNPLEFQPSDFAQMNLLPGLTQTLTDDDNNKIDEIVLITGLSRNTVQQTYVACGKNGDMAIDLLFAMAETGDGY